MQTKCHKNDKAIKMITQRLVSLKIFWVSLTYLPSTPKYLLDKSLFTAYNLL